MLIPLTLFWPFLFTYVYFVALAESSAEIQQLAWFVGKSIQFALPVIWFFRERESGRSFPLKGSGYWKNTFLFTVGAIVFGAVAFWGVANLDFFTDITKVISQKVTAIGIHEPLFYIGVAVFYSLFHSGLEEVYWRWMVFGGLSRIIHPTRAGVLAAVGFAAHHFIVVGAFCGFTNPLTYLLALAVALAGLYWSWLFHRTNGLLAPWISHAILDAAIFGLGWHLINWPS